MVKLFKKEGTMFNKKIYKNGFTLAEVLIAVTIVGVIAVLTIPSLLKNSQEKARMTLLKGTVANLSNAVQAEMTRHRATEVPATDIYKNPQAFLEKFEIAKSGTPFATSYKRYSDAQTAQDVLIPDNNTEGQYSVLLKNGVGLGIVNDKDNSTTSVVIDLTGSDKPNMVGADYYILKIEWYEDIKSWGDDTTGIENYNSSTRAGEVSSYKIDGATGGALKAECLNGNGAACFRMVELSGYDPQYLD